MTEQLVNFTETDDEAAKIAARQKLELMKEMNKGKTTPIVTIEDPSDPGASKCFGVFLYGTDPDTDDEFRTWKLAYGRQDAYDFIKAHIEIIDLVDSFIIADDDEFCNRKTCLQFMEAVLESGKIEDPGFDPRDYLIGDPEEEEE